MSGFISHLKSVTIVDVVHFIQALFLMHRPLMKITFIVIAACKKKNFTAEASKRARERETRITNMMNIKICKYHKWMMMFV